MEHIMPKNGAFVVSDLPKDRLFKIVCEPCKRVGRYRRETLLARFGPDECLPEVIARLANCPKRGSYHDGCRVGAPDPIWPRQR